MENHTGKLIKGEVFTITKPNEAEYELLQAIALWWGNLPTETQQNCFIHGIHFWQNDNGKVDEAVVTWE